MCGRSGKIPLPPLKGVRFVLKSRPLLKSKYSFREFTLMWADRAPMNANTTKSKLTSFDVQVALPTPSETQAGVRIRKGTRIGPNKIVGLVIIQFIPENLLLEQMNVKRHIFHRKGAKQAEIIHRFSLPLRRRQRKMLMPFPVARKSAELEAGEGLIYVKSLCAA